MKQLPLLKYCGNHSYNDVVVTANSKADFLGFIFAESKRCVTPSQVIEWLNKAVVSQKIVGVFVNASIEEIDYVRNEIPLDIIQCHGEETPEYILTLKSRCSLPIWKVIHHSQNGLQLMKQFDGLVDGYVIDSKVNGQRGGTGVTFDWAAIPHYEKEAESQNVPYFIAGGINPRTVKELLQYNPMGIDLSSGIEENGQKSDKIKIEFEECLSV